MTGDHGFVAHSLRKLDARLVCMIEAARSQTGREPGADPFRGLYISEGDALELLRNPDNPVSSDATATLLTTEATSFARLGEIYGLSSFELDTLLIALAPEIDLRYERIFAYLQDDVNRKRPSFDLILSVLCSSGEDKSDRRTVFAAAGPLRKNRLINFHGDDLAPVPRREVCVDARIASFLLGETGLDSRLGRYVRTLDGLPASGRADGGLVRLARLASGDRSPLRVYFRGSDDEEKRTAAQVFSGEVGARLLIADIGRAARAPGDFAMWMANLAREAILQRAIVYLEGMNSLAEEFVWDTAIGALDAFPGTVIISGSQESPASRVRASGMITVTFEIPGWSIRRQAWKAALRECGMRTRGAGLDALAECFRFTRSQIEDVAETAANLAVYRGEPARIEHAFEAARIRSGHELGTLTRRVKTAHGWSDIVLPPEAMEQLREICRRVARRHQVLGKWGFERKLSGGKGVNALFHGHSGTGKTMAAEVVAHELQLDLYKIDLAGVVSKYIGETEKNLDRIFSAAENANAILLFDEADSLFGKRSEVRDSHDRYANLEVSYLLQKMEQHEGVSILATNLRQNLDDAFLRRLAFTVQFPFPDEASRGRIWREIWPEETPLSTDVNPEWLAARFLLNGGNIRNAALAAAYLAVEDDSAVTMSHVLRAVRAEFQKMGKILTAAELALPTAAPEGAAA